MALPYNDVIAAVSLAMTILQLVVVGWLGLTYAAIRADLAKMKTEIVDAEAAVQENCGQLSHRCSELAIKVSAAVLRARHAESVTTGYHDHWHSSHSVMLDSYVDAQYAAAVERAAAAREPSPEARLSRLEPLRFVPRPRSPSLVSVESAMF